MKIDDPTPMGCSKSSSKRKVYRNSVSPPEIRIMSNKHLMLHLKQLEKEEQGKSSQWKEKINKTS